ncbi:MAG: ROK family protein [Planctomycetes bacterium]|nr:ROK family protein [Planctomycetota bacterium]
MSSVLVGIDLGGTNIKIACFDMNLKLLKKTSVTTGVDMGPAAVVDRIDHAIADLLAQQGLSLTDLAGAGIGTPGPADYQAGILIKSTNMPTFKNVPIKRMLEDKLRCTVAFENDGNVACFGEFSVGAGKDIDDMVFFTLGTGIGCGIVSKGRLVQGATGNAAEVGHMIVDPGGEPCNCGQRGCVEAIASASNTARRATAAVKAGQASSLEPILADGDITCKDVYQHLAQGDDLAKRITDETHSALAVMCVNMLHVTDPARIVFTGGMIAAGNPLLTGIRDEFHQRIWTLREESVEILFASLGEDAGVIGAAALGRDAV